MSRRVIRLSDDAELIIDEPRGITEVNRAAMLLSAILEEFKDVSTSVATNRAGVLRFQVQNSIFWIYYQYKIKQVLTGLDAYSAAIQYIESNPDLFDERLSRKAVDVLRRCYRDELKGL